MCFFDRFSIISPRQFGFRPGISVCDQLLLIYDFISKKFDQGSLVELILFDFSEAFDVVNHEILFAKLGSVGVGNSLPGWMRSFLTGRTMSVSVDGFSSWSSQVLSGVLQGSVLGLVLFLLFVNNLASGSESHWYIFADDLKMHSSFPICVSSNSHQFVSFQNDIGHVFDVTRSWGF